MEYISAIRVKSSDRISTAFLSINNCGAFFDTDKPIVTDRPHGRMDFQLIYVANGSLEMSLGEKKRHARGGDIVFFRPHEPQIYRTAEKGTTFYWIHFSGSEAGRITDFFEDNVLSVGDFPEFGEFCKTCVHAFASGTKNYPLYCCGQLISLIALISQKLDTKERDTAREIIEPALLDMHIHLTAMRTNEEYARLCGLSKAHFIRIFHGCLGMPPQKYRTLLTVQEAKHLLKSNSVGYVADILGYTDQFYFSRIFKKHTGVSPSKYKTFQLTTQIN